MAIDVMQIVDNIEIMENFVESIRPPEEIRHKLDISYKIEDQSIIIFEVRPDWIDPNIIREHYCVKTTYVKAKNHWKIFWIRADQKWYSYNPTPIVASLKQFTEIVREDELHCFWG